MAISQTLRNVNTVVRNWPYFKEVLKSYIYFLREPQKLAWGSITSAEEAGLERAVQLASAFSGPIIEIGTLFGHTTNLLAAHKAMEVELITVDNFCWNPFHLPPDQHRQFTDRALRHATSRGNTRLIDADVSTFYAEYSGLCPAMVFIDADHSYEGVKRDIAWAVSQGVPVISGHDYGEFFPGVCKAVDEAFGSSIELHDSVWIAHGGAVVAKS